MTLTTAFEQLEIPLEYPFTIARGTDHTSQQVVVSIRDASGTEGIGAAVPSSHYGETVETVTAILPQLLDIVETIGDPHELQQIEARMQSTIRDNPAARSAVSIALHDLVAKQLDIPLYRYLGLDATQTCTTAYTIGIDDIEIMREKTNAALERGYSILKVKLGTGKDEAVLEMIREVAPEVDIYVDANEAWTPREAVTAIESLNTFDLTLVEQPVSGTDLRGLQYVFERSPVPIAADESCIDLSDVGSVAGCCDIVNIKLMKCGGIREAIRMIHSARSHNLGVMLGCMTESNASIAAGCHLTPLLDYVDLDGSLLLAEDPFTGVSMPEGIIDLTTLDTSGTGVRRQS